MALSQSARVQAIYNAVLANNPALGDVSKVSDMERAQVKAQLNALFGTDTTYLLNNTVVQPGTMVAPAGAAVQVAYPAGTGSVTSPSSTLTGTGKLS